MAWLPYPAEQDPRSYRSTLSPRHTRRATLSDTAPTRIMADENDQLAAREIKLRENAAAPRVKPAPTDKGIGVPFIYTPSDEGTDENLLILLHGLGEQTPQPNFILLRITIFPPR